MNTIIQQERTPLVPRARAGMLAIGLGLGILWPAAGQAQFIELFASISTPETVVFVKLCNLD